MSLFVGDVRDGLREFAAKGLRAQTCVTSPPYWGLRDYGVAGQLGLEPTIAEYVAGMVEVFRLVRDVLADDGTLWLNLGDSYATGGIGGASPQSTLTGGGGQYRSGSKLEAMHDNGQRSRPVPDGLKPKDLCGIPWRVAFALQADGWYLRQDIIWAKPNPMPESVTDRCTKAHEYLFLLAKSERYYYDAAAIREHHTDKNGIDRFVNGCGVGERTANQGWSTGNVILDKHRDYNPAGRNRHSVWSIPSFPFPDAHFATFPPALIEPCIAAGTSEKGHCPKCGKGWARVVESEFRPSQETNNRSGKWGGGGDEMSRTSTDGRSARGSNINKTTGWSPSCECGLGPVPGVVLDPFMGSGTTAMVAQDLGRRWLGCELNPDYAKMIRKRTAQQAFALEAAD